jgi:TnpA family transposase
MGRVLPCFRPVCAARGRRPDEVRGWDRGVWRTAGCAHPRSDWFVLDNDTALAIREHTSDTNGFTEHLFGLCVLLGITFMPRLKDLPDQVLSRMDRDADYGALQPLLRGRLNVELILEQWDQLVRLAVRRRSSASRTALGCGTSRSSASMIAASWLAP